MSLIAWASRQAYVRWLNNSCAQSTRKMSMAAEIAVYTEGEKLLPTVRMRTVDTRSTKPLRKLPKI